MIPTNIMIVEKPWFVNKMMILAEPSWSLKGAFIVMLEPWVMAFIN